MSKYLEIGQSYTFEKCITDQDVRQFAEVTGDKNPLHLDEEYAKTTMFKGRIAHGMIAAGIISGGIAMHLPGEGSVYLGQDLSFQKPVRINDTLTVTIEVIEILLKKSFAIAKLKTTCMNQHGEVVVEGVAKVIPPKERVHE